MVFPEVVEARADTDKALQRLRKFYDYERFDVEYVDDACIFALAAQDQQQNTNKVVISTPGTRQRRQ
jgi:hypothetical protein